MRTIEEVRDAFSPAGVLTATQQMRLMKIENLFKMVANEVMDLVPESANRTTALRKILESKMTCVQEITHSKELRSNEKSQAQTEADNEQAYLAKEKDKAQKDLLVAKEQQAKLEASQGSKKTTTNPRP